MRGGPYTNQDGEIWIERGDGSWNQAQREAKYTLEEMGYDRVEGYVIRYAGISQKIRVTDEHEWAHGDDDGCADYQGKELDDPTFEPCCREIEAWHWYAEAR